jgi:hypothetical protein
VISNSANDLEHSTVALYGLQCGQSAMQAIYEQGMAWLSQHGCRLDLMGTNHDKREMVKPSLSQKRLVAKGFPATEHISLASLSESANSHWDGSKAEIGCKFRKGKSDLIISFRSDIVRIPSPHFLAMAKEACMLTRPSYGIGYRRRFELGPFLYAMAIGMGPILPEEEERMSSWFEANLSKYKPYLDGFVRDVYSWNFLTGPALKRRVHGQPLADWIRRDSKHGRIHELTDTVSLWEVADVDVPALQRELFDAQLIFDYERDVLSKLPPQPPITGEEAVKNVLKGFGMSAEDVDVLKVEAPGKTRKLSDEEVKKITGKKKPRK